MTPRQWETLLAVIEGRRVDPFPTGFIIDSPWLPNWAGMSILDYYVSETKWMEANLKALHAFPQTLFLPGFWSEFGMCSEPSAFGSRMVWQENEFPFAEPTITGSDAIATMPEPDPARHGLPPFILKRLVRMRPAIEAEGHQIRFAVARGPLNIAGFLMGNTEFLIALKTETDAARTLLDRITAFVVKWLKLQASAIDTIDGVLILDDLVGFLGPDDFETFAKPALTQVFGAVDARVRFFHNDAKGLVCAPHLESIGINLFNFSHTHDLPTMRRLTQKRVALLGNIPPRDVLASGTPDDVAVAVRDALKGVDDTSRIILSCGGGMPPGVKTENIASFIKAAESCDR